MELKKWVAIGALSLAALVGEGCTGPESREQREERQRVEYLNRIDYAKPDYKRAPNVLPQYRKR